MLNQLKIIWQDQLWRLSFFCILCMGVLISGTMPYRSIIGIEVLGFSTTGFAIVAFIAPILRLGFAILAGVFADQTGRYRDVFAASAFMGILGGLIVFIFPSKLTFALSTALLLPIATTSISQCFTLAQLATNRNPEMDAETSRSIIRAAFSFMIAIVPPILALMIAAGLDLIDTYMLTALAGLAIFILVISSWPKNDEQGEQNKSDVTFFQAIKELTAPAIMIRVLANAMMHAVVMIFLFLFGLIIINNLGGHEAEVGLFAGGMALVEVPTMLLAPYILRYISKPTFLLLGVAIHSAFFIPFGLMPSMTATWWLMLPAGIGTGVIVFNMTAYVQQLFEHKPGAGGSLIAITQSIGMTVASVVFAVGTNLTDYVGTAWIGSALAIIGAISLFALDGGRIMSRAWLEARGISVD